MSKYLASIICVLLISGCASSVKTIPPKTEITNQVYPELEVTVKATVGQALLMTENKVLVERYVIADNYSFPFMLGKINVAIDDLLSEGIVKGKNALCTDRYSYSDPTVSSPISTSCFVDADQDGVFESVIAAPGAAVNERAPD